MRILHIGEYAKGGVATYLRGVIDCQLQNHDVHLMVSDNSEEFPNIPPEKLHRYQYRRSVGDLIRGALQIHKVIRKIRPDVIHVHSSFAGFMVRAMLLIKKKGSYKLIYCPHGWSFLMETGSVRKWIYSLIERILSVKTDIIINISKFELDQALARKLPSSKNVLVYNGTKECPVKMDRNGLEPGKEIRLLFVGRLDRQKGLDILLDIFREYPMGHIKLFVVGDSVLKDQKIDFPKNVVHIGWVENDRIDEYYIRCDAVIIPSRWEGFGLVAIEAMRNKRAVLASNRGALPELVEHGVNGYIFDINNKSEVADLLSNISKDTLIQMGDKGYSLFQKKFTLERMNEEILRLYTNGVR
ncbi:glycosyltransferase [Paenibacillus sp.]|uniref:glycosyltransferase n=1 Tax=Paenibacillus sp. TaxID=58172 RepID=UPI002D6C6374|nr:glycosyltransferase [Paenibacillus sp.]HZG86179.1 glycosyltransferase [Paenibacillus sp.]